MRSFPVVVSVACNPFSNFGHQLNSRNHRHTTHPFTHRRLSSFPTLSSLLLFRDSRLLSGCCDGWSCESSSVSGHAGWSKVCAFSTTGRGLQCSAHSFYIHLFLSTTSCFHRLLVVFFPSIRLFVRVSDSLSWPPTTTTAPTALALHVQNDRNQIARSFVAHLWTEESNWRVVAVALSGSLFFSVFFDSSSGKRPSPDCPFVGDFHV